MPNLLLAINTVAVAFSLVCFVWLLRIVVLLAELAITVLQIALAIALVMIKAGFKAGFDFARRRRRASRRGPAGRPDPRQIR